MRQPISVLIYPVALSGSNVYFLLFHRLQRRDLQLPAFWQGVSGGLEDHETIQDAAQREFIEETSITPLSLESISFSYSIPIRDEWRDIYPPGAKHITEHVFIAHLVRQQEPIPSEEHDQFKWFTKDEALAMLMFENNIEALKRSVNYLECRQNSGNLGSLL